MKSYEVSFKFETGVDITVEAEDEAEAMALAEDQMHAMSVDSLPDMWPEDFTFEDVVEVDGEDEYVDEDALRDDR
jgi:hypothetical protein